MANLKNRIERLEKSFPSIQETAQQYKYTWSDWTIEEHRTACACYHHGEQLPEALVEKLSMTDRRYSR
ncbi:MAG: hypothetical protein WCY82_07650, partial [Desulfotomaculaceae bacterium]